LGLHRLVVGSFAGLHPLGNPHHQPAPFPGAGCFSRLPESPADE